MSDDLEIRPLRPEEAEALRDCFERCYGTTYVARSFYDPDAVRARMREGGFHPVVAVTTTGAVVGHMALTQRHRGALTVEAGNTVVDPAWRNRGLAARLGAALIETCRVSGYVGFHHYPTTAHPIMQKLAVQGGGVESGIMLAYIPEQTDYKDLGGAAGGRVAVVVVYQPILPAPAREVFVPAAYADLIGAVYARAGLVRTFCSGSPSAGAADVVARIDAQRRLVQLDVQHGGDDLADLVEMHAESDDIDIVHVDVPLSSSNAPACVETLRAAGFFFCAVLPEFRADGDVLRLQHINERANAARPSLVNADAGAMLGRMLGECGATTREVLAGR